MMKLVLNKGYEDLPFNVVINIQRKNFSAVIQQTGLNADVSCSLSWSLDGVNFVTLQDGTGSPVAITISQSDTHTGINLADMPAECKLKLTFSGSATAGSIDWLEYS